MAYRQAPGVGLNFGWIRGEDFWGGPNNDNIVATDTLLFPIVQSLTFTSPPPEAQEGFQYVVAPNATGAWAGHDGQFAVYIENVWRFYLPKKGWRAYAESYSAFVWFDGLTWRTESTGEDPVNPGPDPELKPTGYDIAVTVSDEMYDNEPLVHLPILDSMILPGNMLGSAFDSIPAAAGYAVFRVQRNMVNVGAITIQNGAFNATFTTTGASSVAFAKGDRLTIRAPDIAVAGLKNFGFILRLKLV